MNISTTTNIQEVAMAPELKEMYAYIDAHKDDPNSFKFDLDQIWRHLGYSRVDHAVRALKKLSKNIHFVCSHPWGGRGSKFGSKISEDEPPKKKAKHGGHNRKVYMLSATGLEKLATACGTEVGKKIRDLKLL